MPVDQGIKSTSTYTSERKAAVRIIVIFFSKVVGEAVSKCKLDQENSNIEKKHNNNKKKQLNI